MPRAEQITDPITQHGEGPVWFSGWGGLRLVDMTAGDVVHLTGDGGVERRHVGPRIAALRPRVSGGMVLALERSFALLDDPDGGELEVLPPLWESTGIRFNDGGCDPQGRFSCGSMAYDERPGAGAVYRLSADRRVDVVLRDVTISNGLGWSPDGTTLYYIDTPTRRIDAFDETSGNWDGRRTAVTIPDGDGFPDGMVIDAEGHLWVALWQGHAVHRYSPEGRLEEVVEVPVAKVTACTFGGEQLDELYITTSRGEDEAALAAAEPEAGAVFRYRPGVRGLPVLPFAG